ncbi:hypothetical protein CPB84DRAFT_1777736 [Gymnopilus junonius]|uniref:Uncharacterized protein n=1 Tax=Gymnopilus junonius TaxID=109634 RepID=A0A9P5NPQ5_GYMJU|nr:hypothetical protein CPB84DRAFT_1777736 [Gymnopilus junonius]
MLSFSFIRNRRLIHAERFTIGTLNLFHCCFIISYVHTDVRHLLITRSQFRAVFDLFFIVLFFLFLRPHCPGKERRLCERGPANAC